MTDLRQKPGIEAVEVVSNEPVAPGVGLIVLHAPRTAAAVLPGQFVHLRISTGADIILRRPFSVHRAVGERIEILYQILGTGTLRLAEKHVGERMDVVGPLGHGWVVPEGTRHALLVAGGLGAAPLGMLAEQLAEAGIPFIVAQGAPTSERLLAREHFARLAASIEYACDDGSEGTHGLVTLPVERLLAEHSFDVVYTCGPEPMQRAIARLAAEAAVPCQVSLERLMACGIGACLSCVVTTTEGLKRACVDGPVFLAQEVVWNAPQTPSGH